MSEIELLEIKKQNQKIEYIYRASEELKKYFTGEQFVLEYPEDVESVPDAILVIPFACCVLPMAWLLDCTLILPEIDADFYESIPKFRQGFIDMYPAAKFGGKLKVGAVVNCCKKRTRKKSAVFFSGGLDSTHTLLRHIDEKPDLIAIWGSDVDYYNVDGWTRVSTYLNDSASEYGLIYSEIRSTFRRIEDLIRLTEEFESVLHTSWWYGIKHGIGIISHAAPYVWLHDISDLYIASSNCVEDGKQQCASDPTIDSRVKFCSCTVHHDGYEFNRQDKTAEIVRYVRNTGIPVHLHVCWKSDSGDNCSDCEKCYRTMVGLWIAGADPKDYGFVYDARVFSHIYNLIALREYDIANRTWTYMKRALKENWDALEGNPCREKLAWMLEFDFINLDNNICRQKYKNTWKIKGKITKIFPHLYKLYIKIRGHRYE